MLSSINDGVVVHAVLIGEGIEVVPWAQKLLREGTLELLQRRARVGNGQDMLRWRREQRRANEPSKVEALAVLPVAGDEQSSATGSDLVAEAAA